MSQLGVAEEYLDLPEGVELEALPMEVLVMVRPSYEGQLQVEVSYLDEGGTHTLAEQLAPAKNHDAVALSAIHDSAINLTTQLRLARHARLHPEHVKRVEQ